MFVKDIPRSATSYTVSLDKLKQGVTYEFRVVAVNEFGYGEPSVPSVAVSGNAVCMTCFITDFLTGGGGGRKKQNKSKPVSHVTTEHQGQLVFACFGAKYCWESRLVISVCFTLSGKNKLVPFLSLAKNLLRKFVSVFTCKISCLKTNLQSLQFVCFFSSLLSRSVDSFTLVSSLFPRFCDKHFLCYFIFSSQECHNVVCQNYSLYPPCWQFQHTAMPPFPFTAADWWWHSWTLPTIPTLLW